MTIEFIIIIEFEKRQTIVCMHCPFKIKHITDQTMEWKLNSKWNIKTDDLLILKMNVIIVAHTLIDGGPLECESSANTDELFSSTTITS